MNDQAAKAEGVHMDHIAQIALTVRDVPRATGFYRDVLGMKFLFSAGTMAFFQCGDLRLLIGLSDEPIGAGTVLYFKVADIDKTHAHLQEQGVTFLQAPHLVARMPKHDLWIAIFKDHDGNSLALMSEVLHA